MYWCIYIYIEQTASLNKLTFKANQRLQPRILHRLAWLQLKTLAICSDLGFEVVFGYGVYHVGN